MPRNDFVHLHVHSEYSSLDGLAGVKEYVKQAVKLGQPALALTDHGNMCGSWEFYKAARDAGIEPILGFEGYFAPYFAKAQEEKDGERFHITMLARGQEGYRVLSELNTASWGQFYYKPIMDRPLLESLGDAADHITVLSGCAASRLSRLIQAGEQEAAVEELVWWRETFPHFYIEVMHHGTEFDFKLNAGLLELAERYQVPIVITNDPHFAVASDADHHDTLLAIQTASDKDSPNRFKFDGEGYWLKSRAEMLATFRPYGKEVWQQGTNNALQIAKDSQTRIKQWESKTWQIPKFPDVEDSYVELKRMCVQELKARGWWDKPEYKDRTAHELKVIKATGIADFLLITLDIINYAKSVGIPVGPGRGSVCGTLVGFLVGLHKIDPVRYNLMFERFLNPARPKMPDIDTDFGKARRDEVFAYAVEKYGEANTMMVSAYGKMQVKAAFNSISRSYGINYAEAQRLNKEISEEEDQEGNHIFSIPEEISNQFPDMTATLNRLAGVRRSISAHPAGLIIADASAEIHKQIPKMYIPSSKRWVSAFDKKAVESMGFLKEDFLSVRALDTIAECVRIVKERQGVDLDPDSWVPDEEEGDSSVYTMLAKGKTLGVFQMEGPTNQRGCQDVVPVCFEDVVSITSLYRTGPIAAGYPREFVRNRRQGKRSIRYLHPLLKPILDATWGVILYQEQVMEIGSSLAGFDMVKVDEIKEAIKDKSSDEMTRLKPLFIEGCKNTHRIPASVSGAIWKIIEGYAGYGYNRSHAVAYTFITYQTARLKKMFPVEFTSALLRTVPADKMNADRREGYMREALARGAQIMPPDVNISSYGATPDPEQDIIYLGLMDYAGIGLKQAQKLVEGRPRAGYTSYAEVEQVANNSGVMKVLSLGSALECLNVPGDEEETEKLLRWTFVDRMERYRQRYEASVILPNADGDPVNLVGMITHVTKGTTKGGKRYVTWTLRWSLTQAFDVRLWQETKKFWNLQPGSVVRVMGRWEKRWLNVSCGNPRMIKCLKRVAPTEAVDVDVSD